MSDVQPEIFVEFPRGTFIPVPLSAAGSSAGVEIAGGPMFWIHVGDPRVRQALSVARVGLPPEPGQADQPSRWDRPPLAKVRDTVRAIEAGQHRPRFAAPARPVDDDT